MREDVEETMQALLAASIAPVEESASSKIKESAQIKCGDPEWMLKQLSVCKEYFRDWYETGDRIIAEWRAQDYLGSSLANLNTFENSAKSRILWSDTRLEKPALYSRIPQVIAQARYLDSDETAIEASTILERNTALQVNNELNGYNTCMESAVHDAQLTARGVGKVELETTIEEVAQQIPVFQNPQVPEMLEFADGAELPSGAQVQQAPDGSLFIEQVGPEITDQRIIFKHFARRDFICSRAKKWSDVWFVAFRTWQNYAELEKNYSAEVAREANYGQIDRKDQWFDAGQYKEGDEVFQAEVWEIWCKITKTVYHLVAGVTDYAKIEKPPYDLQGFYPCPRPLMFVRDPETLIPTPEYCYYRGHVRMLDQTMERRYELLDGCIVRGFADDSMVEKLRVVKMLGTLKFHPVQMSMVREMGGIKALIDILVIPEIPVMMNEMLKAEEQIKNTIYEISGRSDLLRGVSDPRETATAQNIKGSYATLRLGEKQTEVARFAKDLCAIAAEIIAENFDDEMLAKGAGIAQPDQVQIAAMQMIRDEGARRFKIEIETDSTIAITETMQKQAFSEYMASVGSSIPNFLQLVQQFPQLASFFGQLLLSGSRVFRFGRNFDSALQQGVMQMIEMVNQPPPPPQPTPEEIEMQARVQIDQEKLLQEWEKIKLKSMEMQQSHQMEMDKLLTAIQQNADDKRQEMAIQNMKAQDTYIEATAQGLRR